jgi:phosphoglycerol transferase MdoB-like AlkP superfamily enzyme
MKKAASALATNSAMVRSRSAIELFWWHFALWVPTLGFKYLYVRRMAFTSGLDTIAGSMGDGVVRYINLLLLITVDILEVSVIVGALFLLGRLLRIPSKALIFASVFLCLMIMGANQYSLLLVASLFTIDTLAISVSWAKEHPYILWQSAGAPEIGFVVLAAVWSAFFAVLPSFLSRASGFSADFAQRWCPLLLKVVLIASGFGILTVWRMDSLYPAVIRGYWSSTVVSFFKLDTPELPNLAVPPVETLRADYERLAYPQGKDPAPHWLTAVSSDKLKPRHIVIVMLETAPRRYYPLIDNPKLPVFNQISQHAIVSDHHYAMSPYTWWNNASIVSGSYFVQKGKGIFDYGNFSSDSIASILDKHGYTTTFVESAKHGWGKTTGFWKNFGFTNLMDTEDDPIAFDRSSYSVTVDKERQSFLRALRAVTAAESQNRRAFVMLGTTIGHYPWPAKPGEEGRSNEEKVFEIAALFDRLLGEFLQSLKDHGLDDQVLIAVTGDHGFRMRTEFESMGLKAEHGDVAFNVPFLLYGSGLFEKQIRIPYVTSHVDIAPTLLALSGIRDDSWLHHGTNMLDQRIRNRATFMMNTNLSPVSGFRLNGCHSTLNDLTGEVQVRDGSSTEYLAASQCDRTSTILSPDTVRSMLEAANRQFQLTLAYFHQRGH